MSERKISSRHGLTRLARVTMSVVAFVSFSLVNCAYAGQDVFTVPGANTWTAPSGAAAVSEVTVQVWGGGGAGGGDQGINDNFGAAGGGGGGYATGTVTGITDGGTYNYQVGAGGLPGSGIPGGDGANSYFVNTGTLQGSGGTGGGDNNGAGGTGGGGSGSALTTAYTGGAGSVPTQGGAAGKKKGGGGGGGAGTGSNGNDTVNSEIASAAVTGGGAGGNGGLAGVNGDPAGAPGGGGGGGGNGTTSGGSGGAGQVIINWKPQVTIEKGSSQVEPTNGNVVFDVVFSENVTGFANGDVDLSASTTSGALSAVVSGSGTTYTVTVSGMTGSGVVQASILAGAGQDPYGNTSYASTSTDNTVNWANVSNPVPTISHGYGATPTNDSTIDLTVTFDQAVTGFDNTSTDVDISGSSAPCSVTSITPVSGTTYTVVVTCAGDGDMVVFIPADVADTSGVLNVASGLTTVTYDGTAPDVEINYSGNDPSGTLPVVFDVTFTENVTGFDASDVVVSGTATNLTKAVGGSGQNWTVTIDDAGGATNGTIIVNVNAGAATDTAGNTSSTPTVIKNSLDYTGGACTDSTPSTITIDPPPAGAIDDPVKGTAVDLTTLFTTTGNVALFTYEIDDYVLAPFSVDTPWDSRNYGTTGVDTINLTVTGTDPDCGGQPVTHSLDIDVDNINSIFLMHNSEIIGSDKWGAAGWGITGGQYGEFTCETCHTRNTTNIKRIRTQLPYVGDGTPQEPTADFPGVSETIALSTVVEGSSDFGNDNGGHPTSTKICEVCHSRNKYHNYDTADNVTYGGDNNHANLSDCVSCHPHSSGFKNPGCTGCHGEPPTSSATMVFYPGGPDATGALADSVAAPGAHSKHAVSVGIDCNACHKGNTMPTVSTTIQMGFEASPATYTGFAGTATGGNLAAPEDSRLTNGYTFDVTASAAGDTPPTTMNKVANDNFVCSNVYCHGNWAGNNGSNNTPSWVGGTTEAECGTCHGATGSSPPQTASHNAHANSSGLVKLACNACHPAYTDTVHLDGDVTWQLNTTDPRIGASATYSGSASGSTGDVAPSASFGTCDTVYCHGSNNPNWGSDVGTITCESCHPADNTLASSHPVHYSDTNPVGANTTDNNSTLGNYIFQCGNCHNPSATTHAGGVVSADQHAQVKLSGGGTYTPGAFAGTDGVFRYTAGTCNFNACHQNGRGGVPNDVATWGTTLPANCTGCHNNDLASGEPMASNAHDVHVSDATVMSIKPCEMCHFSTINSDNRSIKDKSLHVNTINNVTILGTWDGDAEPANNYTPGVGCNDIYCHSDGKATPTDKPVSWTTTIGCDGCHDDAATTSSLSNAHLAHIGTDPSDTNKQFGYGCTVCHVATASSNSAIGTVANHINKLRDVSVNASFGGDGNIDTDYTGAGATPYDDTDARWPQPIYTCSNTSCHGTGSPAWNVGTTTGDCSTCHGMSKIGETAPSITVMDTEGHTADSDRQVGAHSAHLNALNNYSAPITCDNCHNTTVSAMNTKGTYVEKVKVASHNDTSAPAEVTFANIATKFATQPSVYTQASGQCSTYCHGGTAVGMLAGNNNTPLWDQNGYLSGVADKDNDCRQCHLSPPPGKGHVGNEEIVWTDTGPKSCGTTSCHDEVMNTDGTFKNAGLHVNGVTNTTATCTTCHITMPPNTGSHQKHFLHLKEDLSLYEGDDVQPPGDGSIWNEPNYPLCASCHDMTDPAFHFGDDSQIMGPNKTSEVFGTTPSSPLYNATTRNCYNARCHFQPTPDWFSPSTWPGWPW